MNRYLHIFRYIERLSADYGCQIMIKDFLGFAARDPGVAAHLNPYYIHKSPYCLFLKNHAAGWDLCQQASHRLICHCDRLKDDGSICFSGMCYGGFSETVMPVKWNGKLIACICAGGYELDREKSVSRIRRVCDEYNMDFREALCAYDRSITMKKADPDMIEEACGILADFFRMYYTALVNAGYVNPDQDQTADTARMNILTNSLEYIHMNYDQDIRLKDIARFCSCSESYISHIFKKNMNLSVSRFVSRVRIEKAQLLIAEGSQKLHQIAGQCGFSDPNYFSTVFLKQVGMTPSEYKKSLLTERSAR